MLVCILWSRTHWPSSLRNGNQVRLFVYEQRKDWPLVPTIDCSVQSPEPGLDIIIFIFLILGILDSGGSWLLPLQTHPISQTFSFMFKHLLDFVDIISGLRQVRWKGWRRAKKNWEAFCVTRPDGANSHYLIVGDSVKQNPKLGCDRLNTGLSCLPSNSFRLSRFWESLLTTRFYRGCSVIFFFWHWCPKFWKDKCIKNLNTGKAITQWHLITLMQWDYRISTVMQSSTPVSFQWLENSWPINVRILLQLGQEWGG